MTVCDRIQAFLNEVSSSIMAKGIHKAFELPMLHQTILGSIYALPIVLVGTPRMKGEYKWT